MTNKSFQKLCDECMKLATIKEEHIFTEKQIDVLIELVECSFYAQKDFNESFKGNPSMKEDVKDSTIKMRILNNIYGILTGGESL